MRTIFILFFLFVFNTVYAGSGVINFVETTVELSETGQATVAYIVQYRVVSGEMHGFYFSGNDRLQIQGFLKESYATDGFGNKYELDISHVSGDKWDIILADGKGVSNGNITYVFYFVTDFNKAGYLANTVTNEGDSLVVFNWSPVIWDEASNMDHYTLKVILPHMAVQGVEVLREHYMGNNIIQTENFVNDKFLIDYQQSKSGKLLLVFHKNKPENRFDMRTQFYMPADWFALSVTESIPVQDETTTYQDETTYDDYEDQLMPSQGNKKDLLLWALAVGAIFFFVVNRKHKSMVKAKAGMDDVSWDKLDWSPPKLTLSNYHIDG
ncbi:MAG: hypothetical protein DRJ07_00285, partial [Bacteroidetes bacterium]